MKGDWQAAIEGADLVSFDDCFWLTTRQESECFIVSLEDHSDGQCPHERDPEICSECQQFVKKLGRVPFWMPKSNLEWGDPHPRFANEFEPVGSSSSIAFDPDGLLQPKLYSDLMDLQAQTKTEDQVAYMVSELAYIAEGIRVDQATANTLGKAITQRVLSAWRPDLMQEHN